MGKMAVQLKETKTGENIVQRPVEAPKVVEKIVEIPKIAEKIIEVPRYVELTEDEKIQKRISELMECEVPHAIAREVGQRCCKPGAEMDEEDLIALFDCGVFDELKLIEQRFTKRLRRALGEEVSASGSEDDDEDDAVNTDSEYNELDGNKSFQQFELEEDDDCNGLDGDKSFQKFERENG